MRFAESCKSYDAETLYVVEKAALGGMSNLNGFVFSETVISIESN